MNKLFSLLLCLFLYIGTAGATVVNGTVTNNNVALSRGSVQFQLLGCSNPLVNSSAGIAAVQTYRFNLDANGNFPSAAVTGNDVIYCSGVVGNTYYELKAYNQAGGLIWDRYYRITKVTWNINTASVLTSFAISSYVETTPAGDQIISVPLPNRLSIVGGQTLIQKLSIGQDPIFPNDAATKNYVDNSVISINSSAITVLNKVNKTGDQMTGPLLLASDPTVPLAAATKSYVDTATTNNAVTNSKVASLGTLSNNISGTAANATNANHASVADSATTANSAATLSGSLTACPAGQAINQLAPSGSPAVCIASTGGGNANIPATSSILKGGGSAGSAVPATASDIAALGTLSNNITGSSANALIFADSYAVTSQTQTVPNYLSLCIPGITCSLKLGSSYKTYAYTDIINGSNAVTLNSPTPPSTHIIDESHASTVVKDSVSNPIGISRTISTRNAVPVYKPTPVTLTRLNNVVTVSGLPDMRWCITPAVVFNASDTSFNSVPTTNDNVVYYNTYYISCNSGTFTFSQTGVDVSSPVSAVLYAYPQGSVNSQEENFVAGPGTYAKGAETASGVANTVSNIFRKGLNHGTQRVCNAWSLGDYECFYDYFYYHHMGGGNEDDEEIQYAAHHFEETNTVPVFVLNGFVGGTNNKLLVYQLSRTAMAGTGQFALFIKDGSGNSLSSVNGKITNVDPTPPSSLDSTTKIVTVDATVPVSSAWGTFTTINTPPNYEFGASMTTTLTQTGGTGAAHSGWFCLMSRDRFERVQGTVSGNSVTFPNLRNSFQTGGAYQWGQGGMCDSPIGGGNAMQVAGLTTGVNADSTSQVLPIALSPDSHSLVYVINQGGGLRSVGNLAKQILPYTVNTSAARNNNIVTIQFISTKDEYFGSGNYRHPSFCNQNVTISNAGDPSYNGTFLVDCNTIPNAYTFAQTGPNSNTSITATLDFGKENFNIFPYVEVTNTVDETGTCLQEGCYLELAKTDLQTAGGQIIRVDVGGDVNAVDSMAYVTCYSSGCKGDAVQYDGRGIRGGDDINNQGFRAMTRTNLQPNTVYMPYGGKELLPNGIVFGGPWKRIIDLQGDYAGGSAAMLGGNFVHIPCIAPAGQTIGSCTGASDIYSFLDFDNAHAHGDGGYGQLTINQPNSSIDLAFDLSNPPVYSFGYSSWFLGSNGVNGQATTGAVHGNVTFDGTSVTLPIVHATGATTVDGLLTLSNSILMNNGLGAGANLEISPAPYIAPTGNQQGSLGLPGREWYAIRANNLLSSGSIQRNGLDVCTSDGTGCPSGSYLYTGAVTAKGGLTSGYQGWGGSTTFFVQGALGSVLSLTYNGSGGNSYHTDFAEHSLTTYNNEFDLTADFAVYISGAGSKTNGAKPTTGAIFEQSGGLYVGDTSSSFDPGAGGINAAVKLQRAGVDVCTQDGIHCPTQTAPVIPRGTVTFTSIGANACTTQTVSLPGLTSNMVISVSGAGVPAGSYIATPYFSQTDQAIIQVCTTASGGSSPGTLNVLAQ